MYHHSLVILIYKATVGAVVLFVPPNFQGAFQVRTIWGAVEFLPNFASKLRVISGNDKESLLLFNYDDGDFTEADLKNESMDICLLTTQAGSIVVGVAGQDHYEPMNIGKSVKKLWRNIWG